MYHQGLIKQAPQKWSCNGTVVVVVTSPLGRLRDHDKSRRWGGDSGFQPKLTACLSARIQ